MVWRQYGRPHHATRRRQEDQHRDFLAGQPRQSALGPACACMPATSSRTHACTQVNRLKFSSDSKKTPDVRASPTSMPPSSHACVQPMVPAFKLRWNDSRVEVRLSVAFSIILSRACPDRWPPRPRQPGSCSTTRWAGPWRATSITRLRPSASCRTTPVAWCCSTEAARAWLCSVIMCSHGCSCIPALVCAGGTRGSLGQDRDSGGELAWH